jgi:hypothetical protein
MRCLQSQVKDLGLQFAAFDEADHAINRIIA